MTKRYGKEENLPRSISRGRVLCHNRVEHTANMPCGVNGFRAWTSPKPPRGFVRCKCGWSVLPHYRPGAHLLFDGKGTPDQIARLDAQLDRCISRKAMQRRFDDEASGFTAQQKKALRALDPWL